LSFPLVKEINSLEDTENLADYLSQIFVEGNVVILNGDLGTGKTTLIKHICSHFNINNVTSPSFSIVNEYSGNIKVYHFDFYRLKKIEELYDIGFEEYVNNDETLIFIEWGKLIPEILPNQHFEINLSFISPNSRLIKIIKNI